MESPDLAAMRTDYALAGLSEADAGDDPWALLGRWLDDAVASGLHEPNAMALATATPQGRPSNRIVLLKGVEDGGLRFFTGYDSRKGVELETNPFAAAVLLWHPLQRQVRVEGVVRRLDPRASDDYFHSRPRGSQVGAVASPQSHVVADRDALDALVAEVEREVGDDGVVERPERWGGYALEPEVIEFWQGRQSRLHDRIRFTLGGGRWSRDRLAP